MSIQPDRQAKLFFCTHTPNKPDLMVLSLHFQKIRRLITTQTFIDINSFFIINLILHLINLIMDINNNY